jgi:hypothetical protein
MIYLLNDGEYESHIAGVIEGPEEPGYEKLVRQFESAIGVAEPPTFEPCPISSGQAGQQEIQDWKKARETTMRAYRADRQRILSGRFGHNGAYGECLWEWLSKEHGYRKVEWTEVYLPGL